MKISLQDGWQSNIGGKNEDGGNKATQ